MLLNNLHSFLQKQQLDYSVIVVEQTAKQRMNKAKVSKLVVVTVNLFAS